MFYRIYKQMWSLTYVITVKPVKPFKNLLNYFFLWNYLNKIGSCCIFVYCVVAFFKSNIKKCFIFLKSVQILKKLAKNLIWWYLIGEIFYNIVIHIELDKKLNLRPTRLHHLWLEHSFYRNFTIFEFSTENSRGGTDTKYFRGIVMNLADNYRHCCKN